MPTLPAIASRDSWLEARKELLEAEKAATRMLDRLNAQRRALPMVPVEKPYLFDTPDGEATLLGLFEGRRQLIVYHFMFHRDRGEGCPGCSFLVDNLGHLAHLHARDTTLALVSRAPLAELLRFQVRMGWTLPWYSSWGSDFNYDFHVTHDESVAPVEYNFRTAQELIDMGEPFFARPGEQGGVSVFFRAGDTVLHTWSGYGLVTDLLSGNDIRLDLTPLGRQDESVELLHHDKYPEDAR